ncbi:hypothetical protein J2W94_000981 [Pseudoxanthomonas sacheonensis]|uniref:Uncharacterized protein n=1 Tax=Pseudoxanthomonas sacheonensis TaxID=443615 RepID=A0ABU1RQ53_9GAMM|nr:hypothetical protein [Pseudoxanthomonas sacheonensis]
MPEGSTGLFELDRGTGTKRVPGGIQTNARYEKSRNRMLPWFAL